MWIKSMALTNVKSFRERTEVKFSPEVNILVGPNAGGKSNLLEIINLVLRRHFLKLYQIDLITQGTSIKYHLRPADAPPPPEKHRDWRDRENLVEVEFVVRSSDIENMRIIKNHKSDLESVLLHYLNPPVQNLSFVDAWDIGQLKEGQELSFVIRENGLEGLGQDAAKKCFLEYMNHLELFLMLAADVPGVKIRPCLLYMSPYRSASDPDVKARLAQDNYYQLLAKNSAATSHTQIQPLKLAALRFAEKHRFYEHKASDSPYRQMWASDSEVQLVSKQLEQLGYKWEMKLLDPPRNVYEITLQESGGEVLITRASSGEIELISFILGVLGYNIHGGILLIDEPELHLHPRWQGLMRDILVNLAKQNETQVIAATHSPNFVTPETLPYVHRVARNSSGATRVYSFGEEDSEEPKALFHIVKSFNNERMFFADQIILVEGPSDRLLFEALVRYLTRMKKSPKVVEVLDVGGKSYFERYRIFLDRIHVPTAVIADLDYVIELSGDELAELFRTDYQKIDKNVLKNKRSRDRESLAEELEQAVQTCDCGKLRDVWEYIRDRHRTLRDDLTDEQRRRLEEIIEEQKAQNIFILRRGEIEDYLPEENRSLEGIIELTKEENFRTWVNNVSDERVKELREIVETMLALDH